MCTSVIERIPAAAVADVLSHDLQVQIHLERALHLAQSRTVLPAPLQGGPALSRVERCEHAPGIRKGIHVAVRTSHRPPPTSDDLQVPPFKAALDAALAHVDFLFGNETEAATYGEVRGRGTDVAPPNTPIRS